MGENLEENEEQSAMSDDPLRYYYPAYAAEMSDIVKRLQMAMDMEPEVHSFEAMRDAKAKIERLRSALQAMLDCHGKPHRADWISAAAYQHAIEVDAQARHALEQKP
jgi:hypothetical protein